MKAARTARNAQGCEEQADAFRSSLELEAADLWRQHRWIAMATLALPLLTAGLAVVVGGLLGGRLLVHQLAVAVFASVAAGRFIIWTATPDPGGFSAQQLAALVLVLDGVWAVVLTWHAGILFRMPWLGGHLREVVRDAGRLLQQHRWMKRMTLLVVLSFVMLPVSSTGSIGGSVLGRLLGLGRGATLLTVLAGSLLGVTAMLLFARTLAPFFEQYGRTVQYAVVILLVSLGAFLTHRYRSSLSGSGGNPSAMIR